MPKPVPISIHPLTKPIPNDSIKTAQALFEASNEDIGRAGSAPAKATIWVQYDPAIDQQFAKTPAPEKFFPKFNGLLTPCYMGQGTSDLELFGFSKFANLFNAKVGSWDDRREQLHRAIVLLHKRGVDLDAVFEILKRAQQAKIQSYLEGYKIDEMRRYGDLKTNAVEGLRAIRRFFEEYKPSDKIAAALKEISAEPSLNYDNHGRHRRARPGHQPEPWLKEARRALSLQKVPKEMREELLEVIVLIPSRLAA
jgi:hypothetical protein